MATEYDTEDMMEADPTAGPDGYMPEAIDMESEVERAEWLMTITQHHNIAELLDDDDLGSIGQKVVREAMIDKNSRADWDDNMKVAMDLAMQVTEDKTFPWPKAANIKYPLLTTAAIQFAARAYPAIVPGRDIVKVKINGNDPAGDKQERGDRVGRHMSWQLTEEMAEWEPDTDRLLHVLPITGVVFRKTWFDPNKGRNCSQMVLPQNLLIDYEAMSMDDAPRITQCFELYPHQITERMRGGTWLKHDFGIANDSEGDEDAPHEFYEQHRLLDLDDDGYPEPYIVTVHKDTGSVCRIVARFDEEGIKVNEMGEIIRIKPIQYFTKYGFIPNPESAVYDLGFGMLMNPINQSVNTILNQMMDAGTLQNAGGGFIGKGLRLKGGSMRFRPGEFKPVDVSSGSKIADNIYHMQHQGPSPVLFNLLGLMIDAGKEIASVKDVLTGESQGANASPTTTLAMIEQGLKTFTAIFKRVHRSLKGELKKIYRLNRMYMAPESYFTLLDDPEAVHQADYEEESMDVVPVSDPTVVTDMQRLGKAQALLQFVGDPFFNQLQLRYRYLVAIGAENIEQILIEPEPQVDPKAELEMMKFQLEALERTEKLPAEIAQMMAKSMEHIAKAEAEEAGIQINAYKAFIEAMAYGDQPRGVPGMAAPSGNQENAPVLQGPGAANPGGMGGVGGF